MARRKTDSPLVRTLFLQCYITEQYISSSEKEE